MEQSSPLRTSSSIMVAMQQAMLWGEPGVQPSVVRRCTAQQQRRCQRRSSSSSSSSHNPEGPCRETS